MENVLISKTQAQDFASSCFAVIISEIKDACNALEMRTSLVKKTEDENAA